MVRFEDDCVVRGHRHRGFIAFLVRELVTAHPIVDLRILKNRNFAIGSVLMLLIGALLYATIAILPLFMQNLLHYTALAAGMAMTPFGIGAFTRRSLSVASRGTSATVF